MGSSERALQPRSSGQPSCAMWDPCVVETESPTRKSQVPRWYLKGTTAYCVRIKLQHPNIRQFRAG